MIRVGISDSNELFRYSLESYLNNVENVQVQFSVNGNSSLDKIISVNFINLLIIDLEYSPDNALEVLQVVQQKFPHVKVIVLSNYVEDDCVLEILRSGVNAYFTKSVRPKELVNGIFDLAKTNGVSSVILGPVVREKIMKNTISRHPDQTTHPKLIFSEREKEILQLVSRQFTNQEISKELELSVRTIEEHRRRMMEKTSSKNFIGVLMYAVRNHFELIETRETDVVVV